jgi:NADH-quinone oxidoreductase subunit F
MDLHVIAPLASPAERAAVDAVLTPEIGEPVSGWLGAEHSESDLRLAHTGHAARSRRDLVLPALHAVQDRVGWISEPALGYICRRLVIPPAEAYGIATFYALLSTEPLPRAAVHVCDDMACRVNGAEDVCRDLERELGPAGAPPDGGAATWFRSPCLGQCERAPAALVTVAGDPVARLAGGPFGAPELLRRVEAGLRGITDPTADDLDPDGLGLAPSEARMTRLRRAIPQVGEPGLKLLSRIGRIDPTSLEDYLDHGGYAALRMAVEGGPERVIQEMVAAEVLGRGGAAFPAGRKWQAAAASRGPVKYVVCNADEAEPGTFKDRAILEEDPFHLVESMTIAGFAIGATKGFLYIRGEYPLGEARMANAIAKARAAGLLGAGIMGAFDFDIEIRRGGGAYIAGEGTALFESIEGKRAEPRNKAARSTTAGLFQRPTAVNNVETLATAPWIVLEGGEAFASVGTPKSTGTKLYSVSGHVAVPGVYEAPFGITLRGLIDLAGGMRDGRPMRAANLGGAAGVFVGPDRLDLPLTYEDTKAAGATIGAGAIVIFDETTDLLDVVERVARFFRDESCGQCVPCRVGTVRQEELLARLLAGAPHGSVEDELRLLDDLGRVLRDASICGLGQTANDAVASAMRLPGILPATVTA